MAVHCLPIRVSKTFALVEACTELNISQRKHILHKTLVPYSADMCSRAVNTEAVRERMQEAVLRVKVLKT